MSEMSSLTLPDDVILELLSYLSSGLDILKCRMVSQQLYHLTRQRQLWLRLYLLTSLIRRSLNLANCTTEDLERCVVSAELMNLRWMREVTFTTSPKFIYSPFHNEDISEVALMCSHRLQLNHSTGVPTYTWTRLDGLNGPHAFQYVITSICSHLYHSIDFQSNTFHVASIAFPTNEGTFLNTACIEYDDNIGFQVKLELSFPMHKRSPASLAVHGKNVAVSYEVPEDRFCFEIEIFNTQSERSVSYNILRFAESGTRHDITGLWQGERSVVEYLLRLHQFEKSFRSSKSYEAPMNIDSSWASDVIGTVLRSTPTNFSRLFQFYYNSSLYIIGYENPFPSALVPHTVTLRLLRMKLRDTKRALKTCCSITVPGSLHGIRIPIPHQTASYLLGVMSVDPWGASALTDVRCHYSIHVQLPKPVPIGASELDEAKFTLNKIHLAPAVDKHAWSNILGFDPYYGNVLMVTGSSKESKYVVFDYLGTLMNE